MQPTESRLKSNRPGLLGDEIKIAIKNKIEEIEVNRLLGAY
ncbi:MAG: hypothetical protein WAK17_26080 [Candidatus Nitrosopolaris sp.]